MSSIRFSGFRSIVEQHFRSMHEYVSDSNGNIKANYILRKESLDKDWRHFCRIKGLKYNSLKYINKTKSKKKWNELYRNYPKASQLVYDLYKKDFDLFRYELI